MKIKILLLGAHPDDIESTASAFLIKKSKNIEPYVLVFSDCEDQPGNEGITKEFEKSMNILNIENYKLLDIPDTKFPRYSDEIRSILEDYKDKFKPDIIVTHEINNLHQDHKTLAEESLRVFRTQSIIMYEGLKSTPYFSPNLFIVLTEDELEKKMEVLKCYKTQYRRYYYDFDFIRALAMVRGKQMGMQFAEVFRIYQFVSDVIFFLVPKVQEIEKDLRGDGKD